MKTNQATIRSARRDRMAHAQGQSKYAQKVKAGNQLYGPGCCAHRIKTPNSLPGFP